MGKKNYHYFHGKQRTVKELVQYAKDIHHLELTPRLINKRLRNGWTINKTISTPIQSHVPIEHREYIFNGQTISKQELINKYYEMPNSDFIVRPIICMNLNELVKANNIGRHQMAKYCNTNTDRINKYLTQQRTPNIVTLVKLARLFNVSLDYLVKPHEKGEKTYGSSSNHSTSTTVEVH